MSNSKKDFFRLFKTAIDSINSAKLIRNSVIRSGSTIKIPKNFLFNEQKFKNECEFTLNKNVYIAAFGKAALGMALEMEKIIGNDLVNGIAIIPFNDWERIKTSKFDTKINFFFGGKFNMPDQDSVSATKKIFKMVSELKETDLFIALVSGGGSALLTLPENITNDEIENFNLKISTIKTLVKSGVTINELNTVRSCLSQVKNGKLSYLAHPAQTISLVISDVIDDPLDIISSGPCCVKSVGSPSEQAKKALRILEKYELVNKVPQEVIEFLKSKISSEIDLNIEEFIKDERVYNYLIGKNRLATMAVYNDLECDFYENDFREVLTNSLNGEAKIIGSLYAIMSYFIIGLKQKKINLFKDKNEILELVQNIKNQGSFFSSGIDKNELNQIVDIFYGKIFSNLKFQDVILRDKDRVKIGLISGGETTVNMRECNTIGKGGRNQELTLAFDFGSDGIDGPTDAAGAYYLYDSNFVRNTQEMLEFLSIHDSYNYFLKYDRLLKTGSTGTNVSDLNLLLINF
ncbi:unnamed protein product [Brachionus calyciflorus]|uniref:Glycerate kinase n=1 Tax=Brachionus calyciflorus TaxID=104777 RepID=A0A813T8F4_9BILA|nr:unnamed protein product [Brachionus calyciflorus]